MVARRLGRTDLRITPIGFGAFKIGRNEGIKYPQPYSLPDELQVERLLNGVLDLGVNYLDTAPAYGLSEERIGRAIAHRRREFVISTKVGESFEAGRSTHDFSARAVRESVARSLKRLRSDVLDIVFVHSHGDDMAVQDETDVVGTLEALRSDGLVRAIGFSGKTVDGAQAALPWADAIMVEYRLGDDSHAPLIAEAAARGVGVVVKKGFQSGRLDPSEAIRFVLCDPGVTSLLIGGLDPGHVAQNVGVAEEMHRRDREEAAGEM